MEHKTVANAQKHTHFAAATSQHTDQSLQKSLLFANVNKIGFKKFPMLHKNKKRNTQSDTTMTQKLNIDNGLQDRTTITTGYNMKFGSMAGSVLNSTAVLRLNFCAKNPRLRQASQTLAVIRSKISFQKEMYQS